MRNEKSRYKLLRSMFKRRPYVGTSRKELCRPARIVSDFFDRTWYLRNNADIANSGIDPWIHYLDVGAREGRKPGPGLDSLDSLANLAYPEKHGPSSQQLFAFPTASEVSGRSAVMRTHINKRVKILEFGPLCNPIATKSEGYHVYSIDNASKLELTKRYAGHNDIDISKIEEVDFIWKDADVLGAIPTEHYQTFDVVLISHVIEHIPNPIGFLQSLQKLIKPGGYVSVAVPDKRFCFDYFRPLATTGSWLEAMECGNAFHTRKTLFEFKSMAIARRGGIAWTSKRLPTYDMTFIGSSLSDSYKDFTASKKVGNAKYIDAHAWVFTPSSLALILNECHALGLISLVPEHISTQTRGEFFVHLRLAYRRPISHHERIQLLVNCASEQAIGFRAVRPVKLPSLRSFATNCLKLFGS
jgi:2-polyprenyl-3-methyl-5-hydroxy-6-metoxy-1,4-benzoquinol methylase